MTDIVQAKPIAAKPVAKRENFLDFFRAICLLFVMFGHRTLLPAGVGVFVLPGFFIASGYFYKENQGDFKTFLVRRIKRLLVPFWTAMCIMLGLEVLRAYLFGYGDYQFLLPGAITMVYGSFRNFPVIGEFGEYLLKIVSYKPQTTPGAIDMILGLDCHLWFLPALFTGDLLMYGLFKFRKNKVWFDVLAIVVLLLLAGIETIPGMIQLPYALGRGCFAAAMMLAGYRMKTFGLFTPEKLKWQIILAVIALAPSVLSVIYKYDGTGIVRSDYGQPMFLGVFITYICGLSFAYLGMYLMYWLAKIPENPVSNLLAFAGRNSLDVYLWHMLVYFVGDLFMVYVLKAPITRDQFFMEIFEGTQTLYRVLIVFITYAVLLLYSYLKGMAKAKIQANKKAKAA